MAWKTRKRTNTANRTIRIAATTLASCAEAEKKQRERGVDVWLAHLNPGVLAAVQLSPPGATLGRERMYFDLEEALAAWQAHRSRDTANGAPR